MLVVCDPRLLGRSYGHRFLESLPAMARTRSIDDVRAFFETAPGAGGAPPDPVDAGQAAPAQAPI